MDGSKEKVVLGDCTTVPPGFDQPALFETIERGSAPTSGRGTGDTSDDMYALGVTLVYVLSGGNPIPHIRSEEEMLFAKMVDGSYGTLIGNEPIALTFLEPLRGLLAENATMRWGLEQLDLWVNGRRLTPLQKRAGAKAKRPISYNGREHISPRTLSLSLSRSPANVGKLVKDELLETWLRRELEDSDKASAVSNAIHMASSYSNDTDYLASRIAMVLDPSLPMRYKDFCCMPDGYGTALAYSVLHKGNNNTPAEIVLKNIPRVWFDQQSDYNPIFVALEKSFDQLAAFFQSREIGYGMERCLYETNSTLPCQSPLIVDEYAVTIKDLLPALERKSSKVDPKKKPLDRHIAAFIPARINQKIDPHLKAIADPKEAIATLGMLSLLATVQWTTKATNLGGLTSWLGAHMGPAIKAYHSRSVRKILEKEVPKLVRQGSLADLFNLLDDAEKRQSDSLEFERAQQEFEEAETEIHEIESGGGKLQENSQRIGQQAAATGSLIISLIIIAVVFLGNAW